MINIFWFRRDLRLDDNRGLSFALSSGLPVLPVFIFDTNIIGELSCDDPRIYFIFQRLNEINNEFQKAGSSLYISTGDPIKIWDWLIVSFKINKVFVNKDYEPYAVQRDEKVKSLLNEKGICLQCYKDSVIFEEREILKADEKPYSVFTPYRNKWMETLTHENLKEASSSMKNPNYYQIRHEFPSIEKSGFKSSDLNVLPFDLSVIREYDKYRNYPASDRTSYLGPHLRFGTVSIRKVVQKALNVNEIFLNELIWREFFMQVLFNFPGVVTGNFKSRYDFIEWRNNEEEFKKWCNGETGYPFVDAGMRQLNETGYMHNRVRMITAGFLCKHLLIDWRWGEAWFAKKLLDYELSSNNGNWQWAAGTGCDAAPYFRIFNPLSQQKKFDPENIYTGKWCTDYKKHAYPEPIVNHDFARKRALDVYSKAIIKSLK